MRVEEVNNRTASILAAVRERTEEAQNLAQAKAELQQALFALENVYRPELMWVFRLVFSIFWIIYLPVVMGASLYGTVPALNPTFSDTLKENMPLVYTFLCLQAVSCICALTAAIALIMLISCNINTIKLGRALAIPNAVLCTCCLVLSCEFLKMAFTGEDALATNQIYFFVLAPINFLGLLSFTLYYNLVGVMRWVYNDPPPGEGQSERLL